MKALEIRVQIPAPPPLPLRFSAQSVGASSLPIQTAENPYRSSDIAGAVLRERLAGPLADPSVRFLPFDRYSVVTAHRYGDTPSWRINMKSFHADPVADLTLRLRSPLAWSLRHPLKAVRRAGRLLAMLSVQL